MVPPPTETDVKVLSNSFSVLKESTDWVLPLYQNILAAALRLSPSENFNRFSIVVVMPT